MKKETFLITMMVLIGFLAGSQSACGVSTFDLATAVPTVTAVPVLTDTPIPPSPTQQPTDTPIPPSPTSKPTDTATPDPEPVSLDLCSLVTVEEAEALLGEPLSAPPTVGIGNCIYSTASGKSLNIGAAQGEDAKAMSLLSTEIMIMFAGDEAVGNAFLALKEQSEDMNVQEVVTEVLSLFGVIGYATQPIDDLGDMALWSVQSDFDLSSLHLVKDDVYLYINVIGLDEETAMEAAVNLSEQTLDRLPAKFTIPTSGQFEYSATAPAIEITVEIPIPTITAEPPAPPTPAFTEQAPYTDDCMAKPEGSVCLGFDDGYIWLVYDSIQGWRDEEWEGQAVQVAEGYKADYHHILRTNLIKELPR